jgi:hypothetical protein
MSCVSATSAVARVAPTARVANKRAANVAPMRAARVNVVAAVDLNGASLLRPAAREPVAVAARAFPPRVYRSTPASERDRGDAARTPQPRVRAKVAEKTISSRRLPRGALFAEKERLSMPSRFSRSPVPNARAPT